MGIHHAFSESDLGHRLAEQVRYAKYKPDSVSNQEWVRLLGADVNNLTHLPLTRGLTRAFISNLNESQPHLLSIHDEQVLETAALIHDWAEAVIGDVSYGDVTAEDKIREEAELDIIVAGVTNSGSVNTRSLILEAKNEVVFDSSSRLGHIFNTIERIGYVRTGLRAAEHVLEGTAPKCEQGLRWLVVDVLSNHTVELLSRAPKYDPLYDYLLNMNEQIVEAFSVAKPEVFELYSDGGLQKEQEFYEAETAFQQWRYEQWHVMDD